MDKKALTETGIRPKFIPLAIVAKWDVMTQVLEERFFTDGLGIVCGKMTMRGTARKADYSSSTSRISRWPSWRPRTTSML